MYGQSEHKENVKQFKQRVKRVKKQPPTMMDILIKAGILTKSGKPKPRYLDSA